MKFEKQLDPGVDGHNPTSLPEENIENKNNLSEFASEYFGKYFYNKDVEEGFKKRGYSLLLTTSIISYEKVEIYKSPKDPKVGNHDQCVGAVTVELINRGSSEEKFSVSYKVNPDVSPASRMSETPNEKKEFDLNDKEKLMEQVKAYVENVIEKYSPDWRFYQPQQYNR